MSSAQYAFVGIVTVALLGAIGGAATAGTTHLYRAAMSGTILRIS